MKVPDACRLRYESDNYGRSFVQQTYVAMIPRVMVRATHARSRVRAYASRSRCARRRGVGPCSREPEREWNGVGLELATSQTNEIGTPDPN